MHLGETVNIFRLRKCFHGNLTILHNTGDPSSLQERGRDSCLRTVLCYKRSFTKALAEPSMGCKRFFLKARTNVMFLNKINLPYCLVVFFVARVLGRFAAVEHQHSANSRKTLQNGLRRGQTT